jgi:hypothetical protein
VLVTWLAYKAERREGYKPIGLEQFVSVVARRIAEQGAGYVIKQFQRAMSSNWQGWDFELPAEVAQQVAKPRPIGCNNDPIVERMLIENRRKISKQHLETWLEMGTE